MKARDFVRRLALGFLVVGLPAVAWAKPKPVAPPVVTTESHEVADDADDYDRHRPFEGGLFAGAHWFAKDHGLGRAEGDPTGLSPKNAPAFGGRLGWGLNRYVFLEGEFLVSKSGTRDGQTPLWVFGYRAQLGLNLVGRGPFRPFIVLGGGGLNSVAGDSTVVPSDADLALHAGLGFKLVLGGGVGLRFDGRILAPPAFASGVIPLGDESHFGGPDWEALGTFYVALGGTTTQTKVVVVAPAAAPEPENPDPDGDGIAGDVDRCPQVAEDKDGFEDRDGCPEFDNDGDGIPDAQDKCPNKAEDKNGIDDDDGCPENDLDGDGVMGSKDRCPNDPEDVDGYQDDDGCPDNDNDADGIADRNDKCPNEAEDKDTFQDQDGCPEPDNDNDGLLDLQDRCPNEPEDKDGYQDDDGCPDPDNDGDGIIDAQDKCPSQPETKNGFQDDDGCPDDIPKEVKKFTGAIRGINFETNSASITPDSFVTLDAAARVLTDFASIRLEISGHTDDRGSVEHNRTLSQNRAEAVRDYLIGRGVDPTRLTAVGYGYDRPVASNKTADGRAKNRRIEFQLLTGP